MLTEYEAREETRADDRHAEMATEAILPLAEENIAFVSIGVGVDEGYLLTV